MWFATIGVLGAISVLEHPTILLALDPRYGVHYLATHGFTGFTVLGAVFLSATGAEALYADMGHFGARPIRFGWYSIVLPMLVLNYAGQAALVVTTGIPAGSNPFFLLGPGCSQAASGLAPIADLGPRSRTRKPRSIHCCYRRASIFLRPLEPMATRQQREYEWLAPTVLPQRGRSLRRKPSPVTYCSQEIEYPTAGDPALEDASVYSRY